MSTQTEDRIPPALRESLSDEALEAALAAPDVTEAVTVSAPEPIPVPPAPPSSAPPQVQEQAVPVSAPPVQAPAAPPTEVSETPEADKDQQGDSVEEKLRVANARNDSLQGIIDKRSEEHTEALEALGSERDAARSKLQAYETNKSTRERRAELEAMSDAEIVELTGITAEALEDNGRGMFINMFIAGQAGSMAQAGNAASSLEAQARPMLESLQEHQDKLFKEQLHALHSDWEEIDKSREFAAWLGRHKAHEGIYATAFYGNDVESTSAVYEQFKTSNGTYSARQTTVEEQLMPTPSASAGTPTPEPEKRRYSQDEWSTLMDRVLNGTMGEHTRAWESELDAALAEGRIDD